MEKTREHVSEIFEESFLSMSLEQQIRNCDHYELAALFESMLGAHQPILEAGSGSGRWVAWFSEKGWRAVGVDWSQALCEDARLRIPSGEFVQADMDAMPFEDASFGSIVALGSIEHTEVGPRAILHEFHRVLSPTGVAIVTVPYLGLIRRLRRAIRRCAGKRDERLVKALPPFSGHWAGDFRVEEDGSCNFFQYVFSKRDMRAFLRDSGFSIVREFVEFQDEGVLLNYGRLAGDFDYNMGRVRFSVLGRMLKVFSPKWLVGHMLCYVVKKG